MILCLTTSPSSPAPWPPPCSSALPLVRYLKAAGITRRYAPHTLRDTFATQFLNAGTALEVVQELMGHRSMTTSRQHFWLFVLLFRIFPDKFVVYAT